MSRSEDVSLGALPLQTLQANIDYGFACSYTTYGVSGVKVWIYNGMYSEVKEGEIESKAAGARPRGSGTAIMRPDWRAAVAHDLMKD